MESVQQRLGAQKLGALPCYAEGGLISKLFGSGKTETVTEKYARQDAERAAKAAKSAPAPAATPAPDAAPGGALNPANALAAREKAAGLAKGGPVKGKGTATSDSIPIMASKGEFMVKAKAVKKLGVPFMHKINAIADGDKESPAEDKSESRAVEKAETNPASRMGVVRKTKPGYEGGGSVNWDYDPQTKTYTQKAGPAPAPVATRAVVPNPGPALPGTGYQPNFTTGQPPPPPAPSNALVTTNGLGAQQVRAPGTSVVPIDGTQRTGYQPNFTQGGAAPAADTSFGDEAVARARSAAAQRAAGPAPNVEPVATVASGPPRPSVMQRMGQGLQATTGLGGQVPTTGLTGALANAGRGALRLAGRAALPVGVAAEGLDVARVATDPNASGLDVATQAAQGAGRLGAAAAGAGAGAALGTAVLPGVGTALGGLAGGALGYFGANKAIEAGRRALGVDPSAPATRAPALLPPTPQATATPTPAPAAALPNAAGTNQSAYDKMNADVSAGAGGAWAPPTTGNVTRNGNSYSGTNVSGDVNFVNPEGYVGPAKPSGGAISAQNNAAADALAARYGQTSGFGVATRGGGAVSSMDTSQGYAQDKRELARIDAGKEKDRNAIRDQDIANQSRAGNYGAVRVLSRQIKREDATRLADQQAATTGAAQKLAQDRFGLDKAKFGLEATGAATKNKAEARLGAIYDELGDPKTTAARRLQLTDEARVRTNHFEKEFPPVRMLVVPGGVDAAGVKEPSRVFDPDTRQFVGEPAALPPGMKRQVGTSGGKPVYEDANGKRFVGG